MTRRRPQTLLAALLSAMLLLSACGGGGDMRVAAVEQIATEVYVPLIIEQETAVRALADAVAALCAAPSTEALDAARVAWHEAIEGRERLRPNQIGSAGDRESMARVDWPADREAISQRLAAGEEVTEERLVNGAASVRGLWAIEVLLFGDGAEGLADGEGARCAYAAAAANLVQQEAARLADETARDVVRLSGTEPLSMTTGSAVDEIVNQQINVLDDLADRWLGQTWTTIDGPAGHAADVVVAVLDGLRLAYRDQEGWRGIGVAVDPDISGRIVDAVDEALGAVTGLDLEDVAQRQQAMLAVEPVRMLVRTEVVSTLDVVVTFSDNDGDSG